MPTRDLSDKPSGEDFQKWADILRMQYDQQTTRVADRLRAEGKNLPGSGQVGFAPILSRGLIPTRNKSCPCGSGRKYKLCCRRAVAYV